MTTQPYVIHWFRRDLRLHDNTALLEAGKYQRPILPIFIFDPKLLSSRMVGANRVAFMLNGLQSLQSQIAQRGGKLLFFKGDSIEVFETLSKTFDIEGIFYNKDYTPYAAQRDKQIQQQFEGRVYAFDDAVIMSPGRVLTQQQTPYTVYTPFKKKWRELTKSQPISAQALPTDIQFTQIDHAQATPLPSADELGFSTNIYIPEATEQQAQTRLDTFLNKHIHHYDETRNDLTLHPFRVEGTTSQLSPYLRMGLLSVRQVIHEARQAYQQTTTEAQHDGINTWVDEIIWREFYIHIGAAFPYVYRKNFRSQYDQLEWDNDTNAFEAWKQGQTGYPIVDAAMRQLQQTGWMPNRARMIVSSFLTKDLLIDWRWGEAHFMQHLLDGDPAANNGGWQWAAGTGTDAQPYFRIFNPVSQSKKFDSTGAYIRTWIPELEAVPNKWIHAPWESPTPPKQYPLPIIDHKMARERTLAAFKAIQK